MIMVVLGMAAFLAWSQQRKHVRNPVAAVTGPRRLLGDGLSNRGRMPVSHGGCERGRDAKGAHAGR
jgi:hypothetical protein